jgi:polysaccharide pyruvyl transferase WcaK-like protein
MPSVYQSQPPRRVFITGMFDMRNFGDLMFPLIARERLARMGIDVVPVSPTGADTGLGDAMPSVPLQEMLAGDVDVCGILVGGGYIIHTHKMHFLDEYQSEALAEFAGPGLWLGATLAASVRDVPLVWNAPGVPHPFAQSQRPLIDAALRAADHLCVRDQGGAELLDCPSDIPVGVVPDPVASIADMWTPQMLAPVFQSLIARKGGDPRARYMALHFRNRSLVRIGAAGAAALVDDFAHAHDLRPILVAVGQTHADDILAREIASHLKTTHMVLDDPVSLIEIAAAVALSSLYVGASLHGYVVAAAYGVPGVLVAQPSYRKFQGFLDHTGRHQDLVHNWKEAFETARERVGETTTARIPQSVLDALDTHWNHIGEALSAPCRKRNERRVFLHRWLRAGTDAGGLAWSSLPFVRRRVAQSSVLSAGERK